MDTSLALLGLLGRKSGYGYDLKHSYDEWFGRRKPLAFGQVYAILARLLRDGLIATVGAEAGAGPTRKRYEITEAGRARIAEWISTPDAPANSQHSNLFAKTIIALMLGDDAERLLDLQRAEHMARMRELTKARQHASLKNVLMIDHALFHIEADLRWIDLTSSRIGELRDEVLP
ncbi:MAG: PadR family transcriptional regulator [Actinomycetaceae bacterium]|nr:PadR family transcriptional regulator [Actinomycetaceae bacterium]